MASTAALGARSSSSSIDRLFEYSLLGMLASGFLAVLGSGFLDTPTAAITAAALILRALLTAGIVRLHIPGRAVMFATLAYICFYPLDYLFVSREFVPATVHLIFFLAVTKLLTGNTDRDFAFMKAVAFLELLAASILSGSVNFFGFLCLFLLFAVATFATGEIRRSARKSERLARGGMRAIQARIAGLTVAAVVGILGLTGGMFFVLPRTARAAFQRLVPERYHLPGFANEVVLGQIGEIKGRTATVMRVRRPWSNPDRTPEPLPPNLKWRGTALASFDGRKWYNQPQAEWYGGDTIKVTPWTALIPEKDRPPLNKVVRFAYEVHTLDIGSDTLFFAGVPEMLHIGNAKFVKRSPSGSYYMPYGMGPNASYQVQAYLPPASSPSADPRLGPPGEDYLQLPDIDRRIPALAQQWTAGLDSPDARAEAIERHLRQDFKYTLDLPSTPPPDPLANFLFERRAGYCEYFASAMAVMLRTTGIPSRVVTGFQSGLYNPISGWVNIRAADAHSWVEAWTPRRGWVTYDPTPPDPNASSNGLLTRLGFYVDAAETFWQEWILNYNLDRQMILAFSVQNSTRSAGAWTDRAAAWADGARSVVKTLAERWAARVAVALISLAFLIVLGPRLRDEWAARRRTVRAQRGEAHPSDATVLYQRMLTVLARRGIEKPAWVTPSEFARNVPSPFLAPLVEDLTAAYNAVRFGGRSDAAARMVSLLERIERMPS